MQEAGDLSESRSGQQALTDRVEELGVLQPIAGLEGLATEGAAAMRTTVTGHPVNPRTRAKEMSPANESPILLV